jgi:ribonuclease HI
MKRTSSTAFAAAEKVSSAKKSRQASVPTALHPPDDTLYIYTDGSDFKHALNRTIGGGAVFVHHYATATRGWTFNRAEILEKFHLSKDFPGSFSNPTAEMLAAANALEIAIEMKKGLNIKHIVLLADYNQVFLYATRTYKRPQFLPSKRATFIYQHAVCTFLDMLAGAKKAGFTVDVRHIKGHSGDKYNDLADAIAKKGSAAPDTIAEFLSN